MKQKITLLAIIIICLIFIISGITFTGFFSLNNAENNNSIKVGVIGVLSGPAGTSWGIDAKNGIDLAMRDIKEKYGIEIEVIQGDSGAKPDQGLSEFKRINNFYNPDIFIVEASAVASAIAPVAEEYAKPIIFTAVAAENITKDSDLLFRNFYLCEIEAPFTAKKAFEKGIRKVAILFQKEAFGESCSRLFAKKFQELGGEVVIKEGFVVGETDFRTPLLKIKDSSADMVYPIGYEKEMLGVVKQIHEFEINKKIFAGRLILNPSIRDKLVTYVNPPEIYFGGNDFYLDSSYAIDFRKKFMHEFGKEPSHVAAYAYDTMLLIAKGVKISREKNISLEKALTEVQVNGINGQLLFNEKRETEQSTYLLTINKEGKAVKVD